MHADKLRELKHNGEKKVKAAGSPIGKKQKLELDHWYITYVTESTSVGIKRTLAISIQSQYFFDEKNVHRDLPELFEVFEDFDDCSGRYFDDRGFTRLFNWEIR